MKELAKLLFSRDLLQFKTKEELVDIDMNCLDEIEKLKSKIDKAIEYINKLKNFKIKYVMLEEKELYASEKDFVKDLLDILKEDK